MGSGMGARLLLVEDEEAVREAVRFHLERAGYQVTAVATAREASENITGADAVVLDWMLPDQSGISWLRGLREKRGRDSRIPVLMLTARAGEADRVDGLDSGADDYLTKPFSAAELTARVRALLRRAAPEGQSGPLTVSDLTLDPQAGTAHVAGRELLLTRREFDLLAFLASHPERVYSREDLLDRVWGSDFVGGNRTVDQHIAQLRAHLDDDPLQPRYIETVRGRGYRLRERP
jgi:DNA-binding response OmpR family regulator